MNGLVLFIILGATAVAWRNWRQGIAAAILVGLIQDPLRKIMPGAPAMMTMASLPVWGVAVAAALLRSRHLIRQFLLNFPRLTTALQAFALYLLIAAALSATYGAGSWMITLLGAALYLAAFLMIVAGWRLPDATHAMVPLLVFYAISVSVFMIGGPLEQAGWAARTALIGTEALGHVWVTHRVGDAVYMLSGFFRSPDIMGWHAIMCFMICMIMAVRTKGVWRIFWIGLGVWALLNLWLCGRRKMLAMIPIFVGVLSLLVFHFRSTRRFVPVLGIFLLVGGLAWQVVSPEEGDPVTSFYMTLIDEWDERVVQHGFRAVLTTVQQAGFWGYGLGMSQQGIHNLDVDRPHTWQESGPGKLFAELGVPGSLLFMLLGFVFLRTCLAIIEVHRESTGFVLYAGLFAVLIANLASAVVSAQIYGDPFIVLFMSLLIGLLLSGGKRLRRSLPEAPMEGT
jgi:hypothetical protein